MQTNVLEYLEATARRIPGKLAISDSEGPLTFSELVERSKKLGAHIAMEVKTHNEPVAVFLPKSKDCIVAFAAILYSGNCYVPVDVKSPALRVAALLENLKPAMIITDRTLKSSLLDLGFAGSILSMDVEDVDVPPLQDVPEIIDTDPAYIIHTSGSTGVPKGVVVSHRGILDYIDWASRCYAVCEQNTIGNQAPFHFDNSTLDIYLCFSTGAALVIIPETHFSFPARLIEYLCDKSVNMIFWVPSVFAAVCSMDVLSGTPLPPLEKVLFAGEVMHNKHLNYWRSKFPNALFSNLYGPTEITVDCTFYIVDREFADDEPLPIGFPCRNTDILILNGHDQPCQTGERGELCVRGSSLAMGYWNNPEKTAAAFVQNPLNKRYPETIYRTGDIVYRNDRGEIMLVGRKDFQIKHFGYRIELPEIEYQVLRIEGIANACVVYNQGKKEITLFYERTREDLTPEVIRRELLSIFPKYMLPTAFHALPELPRNPNGKIDRNSLSSTLVA